MKQTFLAHHPDRQYDCQVSFMIEQDPEKGSRVVQDIQISATLQKPVTENEPRVRVQKRLIFTHQPEHGFSGFHARWRVEPPTGEPSETLYNLTPSDQPQSFCFQKKTQGSEFTHGIHDVSDQVIPLAAMALGSFAYLTTLLDFTSTELQICPALFVDELSNAGANEHLMAAKIFPLEGTLVRIEFRLFHRDLSQTTYEVVHATYDTKHGCFKEFSMPQRSFPVHFRAIETVNLQDDVHDFVKERVAVEPVRSFTHDAGVKQFSFHENTLEGASARILYFDLFRTNPSQIPTHMAREIVRNTATQMGLACTTFAQRVTASMELSPLYEALRIMWKDLFSPNVDTYVLVESQSAYFALQFFSTLNPAPILVFTNPPWKNPKIDMSEQMVAWKKLFPDFYEEPVASLLRRYPRAIYTNRFGTVAPTNLRKLLEKATAGSRLAA